LQNFVKKALCLTGAGTPISSLLVFMDNKDNYIELVKKAQLGDEKCMNRLAELARERLRVYVHRLVLTDELTQDILQESMLEMFRFIGKLERVDRFWPWLFRIAANKVNRYYKREQRRRTVSFSETGYEGGHTDGQKEVADIVSRELKQSVLTAMHKLKPKQRNILVLRCYEGLKYSEIAEVIGCSETGAQMRFLRAKKTLAKQLSRCGFGRGSLLMALVLFGKMTAPSEAAAANITVTAAVLKVGSAASVAAIAFNKATIVSLTAVGTLAVGTMVATSGTGKPLATSEEKLLRSSYVTDQAVQVSMGNSECWYYYPPNANGAVMMRFKSDTDGRRSYCQWLQNDQANYYKHKSTMYINNYRMWASDLTVRRLPTDSPQLRDFLSRIDGKTESLEYVPSDGSGLLVVVKQDADGNNSQITHLYDASNEEYFRYSWLAGTKTIDNRDIMHQRGWTYFRITGQVDTEQVQGMGRIPFVYAASKRYYPWLRLKLGNKEIIDGGNGTLFRGLGRPWVGLHTIDTVRRDAAEQKIAFETKLLSGGNKAEVLLSIESGQLIYTIDMETDVIDKISFLSGDGQILGELVFSYVQDIDSVADEFKPPRRKGFREPQRKDPGMLWLVRLAKGKLMRNSD